MVRLVFFVQQALAWRSHRTRQIKHNRANCIHSHVHYLPNSSTTQESDAANATAWA